MKTLCSHYVKNISRCQFYVIEEHIKSLFSKQQSCGIDNQYFNIFLEATQKENVRKI